MPRKITNSIVDAFLYERNYKADNSQVTVESEEVNMFLFGNLIAKMPRNSKERYFLIRNAGYQTNTTKERLNGIPGVSICQKKGVWYLNGKEWNGEWTKINQ